jgi:hypothetical protein
MIFLNSAHLMTLQEFHNGKKKVQKDKQRSTKHTHKTKDRVTRIPLKAKNRDERRCSGRVTSFCSTSGTRRVNRYVVSGETANSNL